MIGDGCRLTRFGFRRFLFGRCLLSLFVISAPALPVLADWVKVSESANSGVRLISQDDSGVVLRCEVSGFDAEDVAIGRSSWKQLVLPGEPITLQKGAPSLPSLARSIIVPPGAATEIRILRSAHRDFTDMPVAPSKGSLSRSISPASVPFTFGAQYRLEQWPSTRAQLETSYILREHQGQVVRFLPFTYYPTSQTLRVYYSMDVEIRFRGGARAAQAVRGRPDLTFEQVYAGHFVNYGATVGAARYTPIAETGEMLIIAADALMATMAPFVQWKRESGLPTTIVSLSSVGSTDAAIKSYVQSYYNNPANNLTYLLLVGDAEDVPSPSKNGGAADPTYGQLAGGDSYPEVLVGRFSGSTTTDIGTMVTRIINHEKAPATTGAWYTRACGIASDEGAGSGYNGWRDREYMEHIRTDHLLPYNYVTVDQVYDMNLSGGSSATAAEVTTSLNTGCSLVNYCGHGGDTVWVTSSFNNSHVNALANTHALPFIFNVSCVTGNFPGQTCFAEAWMRATHGGLPSGALTMNGSSINQSWVEPQGGQWEMNRLLANEERHTFGGLSVSGGMKMMDDYGSTGIQMFETWHTFGDPSVMVRTRVPTTLSVTHAGAVPVSVSHFPVTVSGLEGARVALSHNGALVARATTAADGTALVPVSGLTAGQSLKLTVTAFNRVPYITALAVAAVHEPSADVAPPVVGCSQATHETNTVTVTLSNQGEPGSMLDYTVQITRRPLWNVADKSAGRDITGSTVTVDESSYTAGQPLTLNVTVSCQSPGVDAEYIKACEMDFPAGVTVVSASDLINSAGRDEQLRYQGETGDGAMPTWLSDHSMNWGSVQPGETAAGTVSISVDAAFFGTLSIPWQLDGDVYGSAPHTVSGTITLSQLNPQPMLTLTSPNGGDLIPIGPTHEVTWTSQAIADDVKLTVSRDGGASWSVIASNEVDDGSYSWDVSGEETTNGLLRIATMDDSVTDDTDGPLELQVLPDWLTSDTASGSISNGHSDTITLTVDSSDLEPGLYEAHVNFDAWPSGATARVSLEVTSAEVAPLGTPLSWLLRHRLTNFTASVAETNDVDGDGMPAWKEFVADTIPTDAASCLRIKTIACSNGIVRVSFPSSVRRRYTLRARQDLVGGLWSAVSGCEDRPGNNAVEMMSDGAAPPSACYHVQVKLP